MKRWPFRRLLRSRLSGSRFTRSVKRSGGATVSTGVGSALGCRWSASLLKMAKKQLPTITQITHSPLNATTGPWSVVPNIQGCL